MLLPTDIDAAKNIKEQKALPFFPTLLAKTNHTKINMRFSSAFTWRDNHVAAARDWTWNTLEGFSCQECKSMGKLQDGIISPKDGIFMLVHCGNCVNRKWHVCTACALMSGLTTRLSSSEYPLDKHTKTKKHAKSMAQVMLQLGSRPEEVDARVSVAEKKRNMDDQRKRQEEMDRYFPTSAQGSTYFRHELTTEEPGAYELLRICNSAYSHSHLKHEEVRMFFDGCLKYWDMSVAQRDGCVAHDWSLYRAGRRHNQREIALSNLLPGEAIPEAFRFMPVMPPKNGAELRRWLFSLDSRTSLVANLPSPKVQTHTSGHAILEFSECIQHMFALGIPVQSMSLESNVDVSSAYGWIDDTPRSNELRVLANRAVSAMHGKECLVIPFTTWQDDFDPNNSTKSNRGSVWANTASVFKNKEERNPSNHTFIMALGRSKDNDHEPAQQHLRNKYKTMSLHSTDCFSKILGRPVHVLCYEYARLQDQPERRKDLCLMPGQARYHPRFNMSCDAWLLLPVLRTCDGCVAKLRQGILPKGCKSCVCWDALAGLAPEAPPEILQRLKLGLPKNYPRTHLENDLGIEYLTADSRVLPFVLTAERLRCSLDLVFTNLVEGWWTPQTAAVFMKRECFMEAFAKNILQRAINKKSLQEINNGMSEESSAHQGAIRRDALKHPLEYQKPDSPSGWDAPGGLLIYLDVLMHLLFLGVVKSTLKTLRVWLCKQGKNKEFLRFTGDFNEVLRNTVGMDWLKCQEYGSTGKFGGWVSENFLGFSRLMKWFFQNVGDLKRTGEDEDPGDLPPSSWRKGHYVHWLRVRGLKTDGVVNDLKARRKEAMARPVIPPVLLTVAGEFVPKQVQNMLVALDDMLSSIMISEVVPGTTIANMELKIKHFLTEFDLLDQQVKTRGTKPKVITSFNFLCLLNLPRLTERFGPLRNFWEGGHKGEMGIQEVKPLCGSGLPPNFERHVSAKVLRGRSLRFMADSLKTRQPEVSQTSNRPQTVSEHLAKMRRSFKVCRTRNDVFVALCGKQGVSVIVCSHYTTDGPLTYVFSAIGKQRGDLHFVGVKPPLDKSSAIEKMGCIYERWTVNEKVRSSLSLPMSQCQVSYGVLLPLFECYENSDNLGSIVHHTLIRSERYGV
jgi:hypothetical protein